MAERCRPTLVPLFGDYTDAPTAYARISAPTLIRNVAEFDSIFRSPSTPTEEPAVPERTPNPYDRRERERPQAGVMYDELSAGLDRTYGDAQFVPGPRALAIEDLDALASSAHLRGEVRAQERLTASHREGMQAARRLAWDEGHAQGNTDGRAAMLLQIDTEVGTEIRDRGAAAGLVLQRVGLNPKSVTKAELERQLDILVDTIASLISAHHDGFAPGSF